ncbi:MAG: peptidylprolyl isomerase, partial [Ignavibacteria bacterium]|nr:peptidylprolyl isomerase [Ignavibacteria bacterium]
MNIYKLLSLVILAVVMASCGKQYTSVNVENEIKNGKKIEEVIKLKDREQLVATINTNHGTIEFELYPNEAPKAVTNFIGLSLQGFYNKLTFHRVLKNF